MVKEIEIKGKKYFERGECGMDYVERELAEKCYEWCSTHKSCNLEYISQAVGVLGKLEGR